MEHFSPIGTHAAASGHSPADAPGAVSPAAPADSPEAQVAAAMLLVGTILVRGGCETELVESAMDRLGRSFPQIQQCTGFVMLTGIMVNVVGPSGTVTRLARITDPGHNLWSIVQVMNLVLEREGRAPKRLPQDYVPEEGEDLVAALQDGEKVAGVAREMPADDGVADAADSAQGAESDAAGDATPVADSGDAAPAATDGGSANANAAATPSAPADASHPIGAATAPGAVTPSDSPAAVLRRLRAIAAEPGRGPVSLALASAVAPLGFAIFFGSHGLVLVLVAALGFLVWASGRIFNGLLPNPYLTIMVQAAVATALCILVHGLYPGATVGEMLIPVLMLLVPGMTLTTAMLDTLSGNYLSSVARLATVLLVAVAIAIGSAVVLHYSGVVPWSIS